MSLAVLILKSRFEINSSVNGDHLPFVYVNNFFNSDMSWCNAGFTFLREVKQGFYGQPSLVKSNKRK